MPLIDLSQDIEQTSQKLLSHYFAIPKAKRPLKIIEGTGGKISAPELIAYQIGWGKSLVRWYQSGMRGERPQMPGEGFSTWNYTALARHFYEIYLFDRDDQQLQVFDSLLKR